MNAHPHTDDTSRDAGTDRTRDAIDPVADLRALERVIEPVVRTMGYELVHLEWAGRALRVYIDRAEGITLADCAKLSPILSTSLDAAEHDEESADVATLRRVLAGAYHLEVSSPGLDRPLMRASQFRRFVGSRAHVRTHAPLLAAASQKNFHGRIVAVDPDPASPDDEHTGVVRLADQDDPEVVHLVPLTLIKRANLIYEGDV
jgi:ribosome maturation factor RimP